MPQCQSVKAFCRSELAREKFTGTAFIQKARVIVDVFREQELGAPLAPTDGGVHLPPSASTSFTGIGKTIGFNHLNELLHAIEIGNSSAQANQVDN
ncbi:hypothetical protein C4J95_2756 [Pseudomonas orientalis]|nr:hypothetical protein C4J96_2648 [Pseudomonas orientalis]AZF00217.1 hypothetical protein C4J95_2756 [Pseudomonas orientalis]